MTTCFGQRVTILRSIRAIIYMFLLCIIINISDSNTTVWKELKKMEKSLSI